MMVQVNLNTGEATPSRQPKGGAQPFKQFNFQTTLASKGEEPVQIEASSWRGVTHIGIRQLFHGRDGQLHFGKQGFNIPVNDFLTAIMALTLCFNDATGSSITIHGASDTEEQFLIDLAQSVAEDMLADQEPVTSWQGS
jgi:hypothetical protein